MLGLEYPSLLLEMLLTACFSAVLSQTVALMCYSRVVIKLGCFPSFVISN